MAYLGTATPSLSSTAPAPPAWQPHVQDVGAEVVADICSLSWVNMLLGCLWPKAHAALIDFVHAELTPRLQDALPSPFRQVHFARFSLGGGLPQLGPVEVMRHSDSHVQLELELQYCSDVDILLDAGTGGISFGVRHLTMAGRLCLALKPLMCKWPLVGGVHVFFASKPRMELKYKGLGEFPGLAQKVQSVVDDYLCTSLVLPNLKSFHFTPDQQALDLGEVSPQKPLGVLRVQVLRAQNLAGANWQIGAAESFTSDPFCVLRLAGCTHTTSTVRGTTSPEWPADEPSACFVVYHHEQELEIDVLHESRGVLRPKWGNHLGRMPATSVRTLLHRSELVADESGALVRGSLRQRRRVTLDLTGVNRSMLHVNDPVNAGVVSILHIALEWLDVSSEPLAAAPRRPPAAALPDAAAGEAAPWGVLLVELHSGTGFPSEAVKKPGAGLRWQCRLGREALARSRPGKVHAEEFDPALPLPRLLFDVIDRLALAAVPGPEIAEIVEADVEVVKQYFRAKDEFEARADELRRKMGEDLCTEMKWHETLAVLVRPRHYDEDEEAAVELVDGEGRVVGTIAERISIRRLLDDGQRGVLPRTQLRLAPTLAVVAAGEERGVAAALSSWLFPFCAKPILATAAASGGNRYRNVRLEAAVRLLPLVAGSAPRTVTAAASAVGDVIGDGASTEGPDGGPAGGGARRRADSAASHGDGGWREADGVVLSQGGASAPASRAATERAGTERATADPPATPRPPRLPRSVAMDPEEDFLAAEGGAPAAEAFRGARRLAPDAGLGIGALSEHGGPPTEARRLAPPTGPDFESLSEDGGVQRCAEATGRGAWRPSAAWAAAMSSTSSAAERAEAAWPAHAGGGSNDRDDDGAGGSSARLVVPPRPPPPTRRGEDAQGDSPGPAGAR